MYQISQTLNYWTCASPSSPPSHRLLQVPACKPALGIIHSLDPYLHMISAQVNYLNGCCDVCDDIIRKRLLLTYSHNKQTFHRFITLYIVVIINKFNTVYCCSDIPKHTPLHCLHWYMKKRNKVFINIRDFYCYYLVITLMLFYFANCISQLWTVFVINGT